MTYLDNLKARYQAAQGSEKQFLAMYTEVTGATLSRIWQHVNSDHPFGIITAFKGTKYREQNIADNLEMAREIRRAGFGYFWLKGYWAPSGQQAQESDAEDSIFVVGPPEKERELRHLLTRLMDKYDQDAVVWKGVNDDYVNGLSRNGTLTRYGLFKPDSMGQAYSKILRGQHAGRFFTFASLWEANNNMTNTFLAAYLQK